MGKTLKNLKEKISRKIKLNKSNKINNYEIYSKILRDKTGLEIGGPSKIFEEEGDIPIYPIIRNLDGCNFNENTVWEGKIKKGLFYNFYDKRKGYQFICDAVDLSIIPSNSYEFILSSHVLEHIANPFKAISECLRVLKDNGTFLLILPHKDCTFDHNRPVTTLEHLIEDYKHGVNEEDLSHLPEILKLHDLSLDPPAGDSKSFKERSLNNYENRCLHHHVFDTKLAIKCLNYFKIKIISVDLILPYHIILLGKKTENFREGDNDKFLDENANFIIKSPFKSDKR